MKEKRKAYMNLESDINLIKQDIGYNRELLEKDMKFMQQSIVEHIRDDKESFDHLSKKLDNYSTIFVRKSQFDTHTAWYRGINVVIFVAIIGTLIREIFK